MRIEKNGHFLKKYIFWIVLALLIFLSYLILKSYLIAILSAFIIAYLIRPVYSELEKLMSKHLAALICIFAVLLVFLIAISMIFGNIISQAYEALTLTQLESFLKDLSSQPLIQKFNLDLNLTVDKIITFVISLLTSAISYLPSLITSIAIILVAIYFILINGKTLHNKLKEFLPTKNKEATIKEIALTTDGIIYGFILIALIEFIIAGIGFWLVGVKTYLLLATLIFFLGMIPMIGPVFVWLPLAVYHFSLHNYEIAIGVTVVGFILSILVDTFLRMKIVGDKARINPFIMLLGIIGGVPLFGIFGFIIGPLILSYTIKLLQESLK